MRRSVMTTGAGLLVGLAVGLALAACTWETWLRWSAGREQAWLKGMDEVTRQVQPHFRSAPGGAVVPGPRPAFPDWVEPALMAWLVMVVALCTLATPLTGRRVVPTEQPRDRTRRGSP